MEFCVKLAAEGILEEVIKDQGKNVVMSPTSMNLLLNMAALGSSGDTLKQFHGCLAENVINEVNSWAEKSTKGLIKDFLPPSIQLKPPLLLANALYFKATCKDQFKASLTRDFHLLAGKTIKVPFMTQVEQKQRYGSFKDFQVVRLYYDTGGCYHYDNDHPSFCMDIILPDRRNGLQDLLQKFNSDTELLMEKLGLTLPFNYKLADFTETIHSPLGKQLFIDKMFQKSCIEVDEEGTEGASVSGGLGFGGRSMYCQAPEVEFVADHPFMFIIREEVSGAVIFTGAVLNPLSA
ncbi:serpin-ZXA [Ziziphus jujuba]|uniref:Serpin-ZXA n=1 Tax=Ziziphus jujuba TaxID=326968 RepID=A0ABM3I0C2_ZIZJJ|nr:serpin-ZXA [Ziziphus jujuba]